MKRAIIFSAGEIESYCFLKKINISAADLVICADGGLCHAVHAGVAPNVVIGDFDSNTLPLSPEKYEIIRYRADKDATDTQLALDLAIARGCGEVVMVGCTGSRIDHTLANVYLLKYAHAAGVSARIASPQHEIMLLRAAVPTAGCIRVQPDYMYISLIPISDCVSGVCTSGVKYPLCNETLFMGHTRGISNEFLGSCAAEVSIESGELLVVCEGTRI